MCMVEYYTMPCKCKVFFFPPVETCQMYDEQNEYCRGDRFFRPNRDPRHYATVVFTQHSTCNRSRCHYVTTKQSELDQQAKRRAIVGKAGGQPMKMADELDILHWDQSEQEPEFMSEWRAKVGRKQQTYRYPYPPGILRDGIYPGDEQYYMYPYKTKFAIPAEYTTRKDSATKLVERIRQGEIIDWDWRKDLERESKAESVSDRRNGSGGSELSQMEL